jgi:hypothetical protein
MMQYPDYFYGEALEKIIRETEVLIECHLPSIQRECKMKVKEQS